MIFYLHGALLRVLSKVSRVLKGLNTSSFLGLNTYLFLETLKKFLRSQTLKIGAYFGLRDTLGNVTCCVL